MICSVYLGGTKKTPAQNQAEALFTKFGDLAMSTWTVEALLLWQKPRYHCRGQYPPTFFYRAIYEQSRAFPKL
tara:strand:+ start:340 stop:558 length:219 start_codon:yes stop_codon:yes gene_type:complete